MRVRLRWRGGGVGVFPVLGYAAGVEEGKDVGVACSAAHVELLVAEDGVADVGKVLFGFGAIEPEGVPALGVEGREEIVPIEVAGFGVGGVVDVGLGDVEVEGFDFFEVGGVGVHEAPDGEHGVEVVLVEVA